MAWPQAILLASVLLAVGLNFFETRGQTFFSDEWGRLIAYSDHSSLEFLVRGYSGNLVVVHALLYKALFGLFGADSYLAFRFIEALLVGTCGLLFYAVARSRSGPWPCLAATLVLLFLGSAHEVLATPFGIVFLLPVAFGLAALVCLQRFPRRGDLLACLLLLAAVASQSLGLAFLAGGTVLLVQQSGRRVLARIWIVLVPGLLYAAWFAWSRLTAPPDAMHEPVHLDNLSQMPSIALEACAAGLSAISGLSGTSGFGGWGAFNLGAGYLLLALLIIAAIWRVRSRSPLTREIWVPLALGLAYWIMIAMVESAIRPPTTSRYLYPSAVFLLLILLELLRGIRRTPWLIWLTIGALLVSLVPNLVDLVNREKRIRDFATIERSDLGALELLRNEAPATSITGLALHHGVIGADQQGPVSAASYFSAVDRYGSPAATPEEIASGPEAQRLAVDRVLLRAGELTLSGTPATRASRARNCRATLGPPTGFDRAFGVPATGLEIRPQTSRADVTVGARRFASGFQRLSVPSGTGLLVLRPGTSQEVRPWLVRMTGATVCAMQ